MGSPKQAKLPNPQETAQAQTSSNINTALAGTLLNNPNQIGPLGSIQRTQTGTQNVGGVDVPTFDVTSSLNPNVQSTVDALLGGAGSFAEGQGITGRQGFLDALTQLQQPDLDRRRDAEIQRLAAQGITPGSEAFNTQFENINRGENDAQLQRILQAGNFAGQEIDQGLNNPIAQALGLVRGSQPGLPIQGQAVNPTDVAGITQQDFQNRQAQANAETAQQQALLGGIAGLGGTVASGLFGLI